MSTVHDSGESGLSNTLDDVHSEPIFRDNVDWAQPRPVKRRWSLGAVQPFRKHIGLKGVTVKYEKI